MATCTWQGKSGKTYSYEIFKIGAELPKKAGNYIFAKESSPQKWTAVYAGETGDLSGRFDNHHQDDCIKRNGATHIHIHVNSGGEQARRDEEKDIRNNYNTPCNKQ